MRIFIAASIIACLCHSTGCPTGHSVAIGTVVWLLTWKIAESLESRKS